LKLSLAIQTPEVKAPVPVALLSGSFEEKLDKAARLGYAGVELLVARPRELKPDRLWRQVAGRSLEVSAIGTGASYMTDGLALLHADSNVREGALRRLEELIFFASDMGAGCVTIGGFRGRAAWVAADDPHRILVDALRRASEHATRRTVRLAVEPLNRYETDIINTADQALSLIAHVGSEAVGLLLDTFHMNIEEPSLSACFEHAMAARKLYHIHVGDSNRHPPGRGHLDFPAIVDTLRKTDYRGYLSAELLPVPDPDIAAEQTVRYMQYVVERKPEKKNTTWSREGQN
jgi:sugar phosphate isomerase/epimerase